MQNTITITFSSDRGLTRDEIDNLLRAVCVQVEEPVDENQEDEEYTTSEVLTKFEDEQIIIEEVRTAIAVQARITTK